jgi:pyrroline-5-carboxylate reductase
VRELRFRTDQTVISCVAGTPLDEVAALVAPARACRLVPLPMIARHEGPIVLYPALPEVKQLVERLGDLVVPATEADFATYAAGSAAMSSYFALQGAMAAWMTARGAAADAASTYVRSLFRALSETAQRTAMADLPRLIERHETPGGLNERVRRTLDARGWFTAPGDAFAALTALRRTDLGTDADG